jgi:hypothetical protein
MGLPGLQGKVPTPCSAGLLGILVGLTLSQTLGTVFFFFSLVLRAPVGEVAVSLSKIQICL